MRYDGRPGESGASRGVSGDKGKGGRADNLSGFYVPWRLGGAQQGESVRWHHVDGRWVAVEVRRQGAETGVFVTDSTGRRQRVDSYDAALELARRWRD